MNVIQTLKAERDRKENELEKLDQAITLLSHLNGHERKRRTPSGWTPQMRKAAAARMRKMWKAGKIKPN